MDDVSFMCVLHRFDNLGGDRKRFIQRNRSARNAIRQSRPFNQFQHQKPDTLEFLQVIDRGDAPVIQRSENVGLTFESAPDLPNCSGIREAGL